MTDSTQQQQVITTTEELGKLARGTVVASDNYADAFSIVGTPTVRGVVYGWQLMNVATGYKMSPAELPHFFPARVVYSFEWAK